MLAEHQGLRGLCRPVQAGGWKQPLLGVAEKHSGSRGKRRGRELEFLVPSPISDTEKPPAGVGRLSRSRDGKVDFGIDFWWGLIRLILEN